MAASSRPFVEELETPAPSPAEAPPVPETGPVAPDTALLRAARGQGRGSRVRAVLAWALGLLLSLVVTVATYDFIAGLMARWPMLGLLAMVLAGVAVLAALWLAAREWAAWLRLGRIDGLRARAVDVAASGDLAGARLLLADLDTLHAGRAETAWARARVAERSGAVLDADALVRLAEAELMAAPDQAARREVEAAARRVAMATALIPLALVDVAVALVANLRMIRRIAEIYGGRAGTFGSWRVLRRVMAHLVATGLVAVGDDLVSSVAGGGVVSKLSRRFGEGVVNGALTARVGIAAMEVCRPLPFDALPAPRIRALLGRALTGMFGSQG